MDLLEQKPKKRLNKYMTALIIVVCLTIIVSATFAWFTYRANKDITFTIGQVSLVVDYCPAVDNGGVADFLPSGSHVTQSTVIDNSELVCNKPLISHYRFKNYVTEAGVNSVDCYVRVLFEFQSDDDNAQLIIDALNENPVIPYVGRDAQDPTSVEYGWVRMEGTNYYYLVSGDQLTSGVSARMLKVKNEDKDYTFTEEARFPNVEILNHDLLIDINYKIKVQAIQANYLVHKVGNIYVDVDGTINTIAPIMNEVFQDDVDTV